MTSIFYALMLAIGVIACLIWLFAAIEDFNEALEDIKNMDSEEDENDYYL